MHIYIDFSINKWIKNSLHYVRVGVLCCAIFAVLSAVVLWGTTYGLFHSSAAEVFYNNVVVMITITVLALTSAVAFITCLLVGYYLLGLRKLCKTLTVTGTLKDLWKHDKNDYAGYPLRVVSMYVAFGALQAVYDSVNSQLVITPADESINACLTVPKDDVDIVYSEIPEGSVLKVETYRLELTLPVPTLEHVNEIATRLDYFVSEGPALYVDTKLFDY